MFTQGLLSQDVRYATECSQCKCVIKEASLPPSGHISAEELQQAHRLRWLDSLIKQEEKALRFPRYSKSTVNARAFNPKMFNQHPWSHKWLPAPDVCRQGNCNERNLQREKTNSTGFPRKIPVDD
ncbi:unnamed protein product [Durusdinium trenchii]|uniref:Uncharacterized protein n=1 Tax=Durusdinium trenchii TaxID=1381693 RepID=A0ABP0KKS5_9DINO|eukprot:g26760.t1